MPTKPLVKWPTVANRHRNEAIMKLGEIIVEIRAINERMTVLKKSVDNGNILLSNAIANETSTRLRLISEVAENARMWLETAPAGEKCNGNDETA